MKWLVVACALSGGLGATTGHAQLYKWVDENGRVQYSDSIPPGSTDRARKELRSDGTVKQSTERAATAEEKRLAALKATEDAKLKQAQDERERKDKALLMTYPTLLDYDRVRDRALGAIAAEIRVLQEREIVINKTIASNGSYLPPGVAPAATPASAAPVVAAKPTTPAKPPPAKPAGMLLLEAKADLPRVKDAILGKRRDLEDLTALYSSDRVRLARLIDAENAKLNPAKATTLDTKSSTAGAALPAKKP